MKCTLKHFAELLPSVSFEAEDFKAIHKELLLKAATVSLLRSSTAPGSRLLRGGLLNSTPSPSGGGGGMAFGLRATNSALARALRGQPPHSMRAFADTEPLDGDARGLFDEFGEEEEQQQQADEEHSTYVPAACSLFHPVA